MSDRSPKHPPTKAEPPKAEPKTAKEELEDTLLATAIAPWESVLSEEQRGGLSLVMELLIKTHPVMQKKIERRLKEGDKTAKATTRKARKAAGARGKR